MDGGVVNILMGFGGGGVTVGTICWWLISRWLERMQDDNRRYREKEIADIQERVEAVEKSQKCAVHEISLVELKRRIDHAEETAGQVTALRRDVQNLVGWMNKVDSKLDMVNTKVSKIEGKLEG